DNPDWHEHRNGVNKNKVVRHNFAQMGDAPSPGGTGEDINPTDPVFSLSTTEVAIGQTARVRVNTKRDLGEIKLSEITYSNPGIVTVDENGVITPLAKGETTISFKSSATDQFNASESRGVLTITVIEGTPTFALWDRTIQPGESTRIVIKGEKSLDGVKLDPITCTPDGIVTVDEDGTIKANEDVKETTVVEITFNSTEVTDRYYASEGNTLKLRVFVPIKGIDEPLYPVSNGGVTTTTSVNQWPFENVECVLVKYDISHLNSMFVAKTYIYFSHESKNTFQYGLSCTYGEPNFSMTLLTHEVETPIDIYVSQITNLSSSQYLWVIYKKTDYDKLPQNHDNGIIFEPYSPW
ncbi:MAG: hypothetical protein J1E29_03585, partial [Duncaniella sp.]|nr:hypothetical protein [Duncaniella sp.]